MAGVRPEHNFVRRGTLAVFQEQRLEDRDHIDIAVQMIGLLERQAIRLRARRQSGIPENAVSRTDRKEMKRKFSENSLAGDAVLIAPVSTQNPC